MFYRSPLLQTFLNATVDCLFLLTDKKDLDSAPVNLHGPTLFGHPLQLGDVMCGAGVTGAGRYRAALLTLAKKLTTPAYLDDAVSNVSSAIRSKGEDYVLALPPAPPC